ncbi:CorA family divalent cation transporter [Flavisphingomonas formosensis]|uniref:CorA family divalent cation transporter n=1 Tax=Flavisphingomonas formosensis TaxID=861534 RepID=UPI0012FC9E39|nr:CorA family divalent cation transporter [Sphingomonas formosensis]
MIRYLPQVEAEAGDGGEADCRWIDVRDPTQEEVERIRERFGIVLPTLEALQEIEASSRLRVDGNTLYMSAPLLSGTSTERWKIAPTGFILTPRHIATVRYAELQAIDMIFDEIAAASEMVPAEIFVRLLEEVVDRAADHLERASAIVAKASQKIFFEEPERRHRLSHKTAVLREAMLEIGRANDRASRVRYMFLGIDRMAAFVMDRCQPKIEEALRERFSAVRHDIVSLDEFETSLSGRVQLLQDAAAGFISIEQNDVVKVLTVVSVVGVPPVLVVGIYGMNFKVMPELAWRYGYPYALMLCLFSAVLPLLWFKWRDWI